MVRAVGLTVMFLLALGLVLKKNKKKTQKKKRTFQELSPICLNFIAINDVHGSLKVQSWPYIAGLLRSEWGSEGGPDSVYVINSTMAYSCSLHWRRSAPTPSGCHTEVVPGSINPMCYHHVTRTSLQCRCQAVGEKKKVAHCASAPLMEIAAGQQRASSRWASTFLLSDDGRGRNVSGFKHKMDSQRQKNKVTFSVQADSCRVSSKLEL